MQLEAWWRMLELQQESWWKLRGWIKTWWTTMKNSGNESMRSERWKNKIQGLRWIRWSWNDMIEIAWMSGKQDEQLRTEIMIWWTSSRQRIKSPWRNKNKNYVMHLLHQFKLMTTKGFGILLILVGKIKRDLAQAWVNLQRTTGRIMKRTSEIIR